MDKKTARRSLEDLKIRKDEIDYLIARLRVDIFTIMFKKELIDAEGFEMNVNLIVALEKAKKGIGS